MSSTLQLAIRMGLGLFGGMTLGWGVNWSRVEGQKSSFPSETLSAGKGTGGVGEAGSRGVSEWDGVGEEVFLRAGAGEKFQELGVEQQKEILGKISARLSNSSSAGLQLGVVRMVGALSVAQVVALLEGLPAVQQEASSGRWGERPRWGEQGPSFVRWALAQKLAAEDVAQSLDLGKRLKDEVLIGSAAAVIAQKSGAEALRVVAGLPEEERQKALAAMEGAGLERVGGTPKELLEVLRENREVFGGGMGRGGRGQMTVTRLLGAVLAGTALENPSAALENYAELAAFMEEASAGDEGRGGRGPRTGNRRGGGGPMGSPGGWILQNALSQMRVVSPEAASSFFDSLGENARSPWMFTDEAISRFRRSGVDAAVSFAETQSDPESLRAAALGTWWLLAQRDREGAIQWIESLPQGAFRQGVLTAVMVDAWNESRTWGSGQVAVEAGAKLGSRASQLDYYATLMADRPDRGYSQRRANSETISQLPVSDEEKAELYRRVAPIKAP